MTKFDGNLTKDEATACMHWFQERCQNFPCQACGYKDWALSADCHHLMDSESQLTPLIALVCHNCGHMEFFSAVEMGIRSNLGEISKGQSVGLIGAST